MYKQGDIVLVEFPYSDGAGNKVRPALVISNILISHVNEIILLPITGSDFNDGFGFSIYQNEVDTPMHKPSFIRMNKVASLDNRLIIRRINHLKIAYLEQVIDSFSELIEII